jgi:hypothetical protein
MLACQFIAHSSLHHYTVGQKLILLPQKHEKELLWQQLHIKPSVA